MQKYEIYGQTKELDARYTLGKDFNEKNDQDKAIDLQMKMAARKKRDTANLKATRGKISEMLKVYFDYKCEKDIEEHVKQIVKDEKKKSKLVARSKSPVK